MVRALNIVLLKLASEAPAAPVICSLVHVLLRCTGANSGDIVAAGGVGVGVNDGVVAPVVSAYEPLPPSSTKPASRLLLRVLAEETRRPEPFSFPGRRPPPPPPLPHTHP